MNITQVGIDLAKLVFQVHGVDARGKVVLRKQLKRHQIVTFFAQMPPCLIGMEACGGAHFWARKLMELGHTVKLIAPQFVKPYVKTNKNDAADAEAICEAVGRPNMRFVPIKNTEQQALLGLVPRQSSSGGKTNLLGISKRGDTYLRTMLIHGARSVLLHLKSHPDQAEGWLARVANRRNPNIAAVALANKNARTVWALLAHGRDYKAGYRSVNPMAI
jgi:transposase